MSVSPPRSGAVNCSSIQAGYSWSGAENEPLAEGRQVEKGPLNVYSYADYIDPATLKKFQQQTGASIRLASYNSQDEAIDWLPGLSPSTDNSAAASIRAKRAPAPQCSSSSVTPRWGRTKGSECRAEISSGQSRG